jgi:hypothetical protein
MNTDDSMKNFQALDNHSTQSAEEETSGPSEENTIAVGAKAKGPRTAQGKARSSQNSRKHSIFVREIILKGESRSQYNALLDGYLEYFQPEGIVELSLVEMMAHSLWRYRRVLRAEQSENPVNLVGAYHISHNPAAPDYLLRYAASTERTLYRAMAQLERLQKLRRGEPVAPPVSLSVST